MKKGKSSPTDSYILNMNNAYRQLSLETLKSGKFKNIQEKKDFISKAVKTFSKLQNDIKKS